MCHCCIARHNIENIDGFAPKTSRGFVDRVVAFGFCIYLSCKKIGDSMGIYGCLNGFSRLTVTRIVFWAMIIDVKRSKLWEFTQNSRSRIITFQIIISNQISRNIPSAGQLTGIPEIITESPFLHFLTHPLDKKSRSSESAAALNPFYEWSLPIYSRKTYNSELGIKLLKSVCFATNIIVIRN